jgi:hypothetical protein
MPCSLVVPKKLVLGDRNRLKPRVGQKATKQLAEIEPTADQESIDAVACRTTQKVAPQGMVLFAVPNHRFDSTTTFEQTFDIKS